MDPVEWSLWSLLHNMSESQQEKLMSEIKVYTLNKLDEKKFTTLLTFVVIIEGKE